MPPSTVRVGGKFSIQVKLNLPVINIKPLWLKDKYVQNIPILYVDNNSDSCEVTLLWLKTNGCEATSASNCAEALKMLEQNSFELFIVEYRLSD